MLKGWGHTGGPIEVIRDFDEMLKGLAHTGGPIKVIEEPEKVPCLDQSKPITPLDALVLSNVCHALLMRP